jgi:Ca-activated chloride channel homolog
MLKVIVAAVSAALFSVGGAFASTKPADTSLSIDAALDRTLHRRGETQRIHIRIGVSGILPVRRSDRAPLNVALVIDRSGSMQGARMEGARRAAMAAIDRLSPRDIVSVISYDDKIQVEVPATRATNPAAIKERIAALTPRGSTAIWGGMQAGASEVRKFKSSEVASRIILLSDGLANQGPSKPEDFARLGRELGGEGILVSTIGLGLGYNEDLMAQLAQNADGSHVFVQEPADLVGFLNREFDDAIGVVAQDIEIIIKLKSGIKPMRSLGRDADINGSRMTFKVKQLVGGTDQVLMAELEVPANLAIAETEIARIDVSYQGFDGGARRTLEQVVTARFGDVSDSEKALNERVMRDVGTLTSRATRQEAIKLRDAGKFDDAEKKFKSNADYVRSLQLQLPASKAYEPLANELKANEAASSVEARSQDGWSKVRKGQREYDSNSSGARTKF